MMKKNRVLLTWTVLAVAIGVSSGCTTTQQYQQMQADITKAQETADAALAAAKRAESAAGDALSQAESAQAAADQAKRAANDASKAAARCEEKCDRMLQKALRK